MRHRRFALLALAAALLAAGCSVAPSRRIAIPDYAKGRLEPLYEAADRQQASCDSKSSLTPNNPVSGIRFRCASLRIEATLDEIRDAGWRVEAIDIGHEQLATGEVAMPVRITIRKLF